MSDEIPILNMQQTKADQPLVTDVKQVLVITNDSTVFLTKKWVSAYEMFGGRFTEVRNLVDRLKKHAQTSFGVISGQFGFVPSNYVIMEYSNVPSCKEEYEEAQERTDFVGKVEFVCRGFFDSIVVCVPKDMFAMLMPVLPRDKVIAVTSPDFKDACEERGWTFLPRSGARVGNENADRIIELVDELEK